MDSFPALCQRRSMPVEMDESMTSSSLNLALSASQQHLEPGRPRQQRPVMEDEWSPPPVTINSVPRLDYPGGPWDELDCGNAVAAGLELSPCVTPHQSLELNGAGVLSWMEVPRKNSLPLRPSFYRPPKDPPSMGPSLEPSLEPPQSLHSDTNPVAQRPMRCHLPCCNHPLRPPVYGNHFARPWPWACPRLPPADPGRQHPCLPTQPVQDPLLHPRPRQAAKGPGQQHTPPVRGVMTEMCPVPSLAAPSPMPVQEMKKTISLPDNCRNLFITYSIDTAEDIPEFVSFLMTQGFRPAIDIFDDPVRRLDINKWMDSFLKDKSVLIIMVISPKYKIDIEGDGSDEHGLHTKYIHSQLQNEFIQQRCLNFRLVPVLFPNATRDHIPIWLKSTRIYRWPQDTQDLLLRLLREERYIAPPMGKELTLTIRPI